LDFGLFLNPDHHRIRPDQVFDSGFAKARVTHPRRAIPAGVEHSERDQRIKEIARAARMQLQPRTQSAALAGPFASSVNTPNSIALKSVFDPQNPNPSCMIPSGVTGVSEVVAFLSELIAVSVDMFIRFSCY